MRWQIRFIILWLLRGTSTPSNCEKCVTNVDFFKICDIILFECNEGGRWYVYKKGKISC